MINGYEVNVLYMQHINTQVVQKFKTDWQQFTGKIKTPLYITIAVSVVQALFSHIYCRQIKIHH